MTFQEGDKVRFLNESGWGTVIRMLNKDLVLVLNNDGIEVPYAAKYLVPLVDQQDYNSLSQREEELLIKSKLRNEAAHKKQVEKSRKNQEKRIMEIDLHIYELVDSAKNLSNYDMLQIQMRKFKEKMEEARRKQIHKLIVIHGVGEGVLRSEIRHALRNYENIEFGDADYSTYGYGATQVLFYKWE